MATVEIVDGLGETFTELLAKATTATGSAELIQAAAEEQAGIKSARNVFYLAAGAGLATLIVIVVFGRKQG